MIACQFEIGDFVCYFERKIKKSMAADLKREKLEFKSLVSGHLYEDFFTS